MPSVHQSIRSMTGFGEGEKSLPQGSVRVQIQSVNSRKGLDLNMNFPESCAPLDQVLRELLLKRCSRGRINVTVETSLHEENRRPRFEINQERLKACKEEIDRAARDLGEVSPVGMDFLLKLPGVMQEADRENDPRIQSLLPKAFSIALDDFDASRQREGRQLAEAVLKSLLRLGKLCDLVDKRAPLVPRRHARLLKERLDQSGIPVDLSDERILRELALFADRCDISEELTRLKAHFQEFARVLASPGPHGRNLDFLVQEMGREINTTANKANDIRISRNAVAMKAELEKIREQIQNLE